MATIAECLSRSQELETISDSARLDTEVLLAKAVNKPRAFIYTWAEKQLSEVELAQFNDWFSQRLTGKPIAYILGEKEFWSLALKVNESTLIPRPDTELLVETALAVLPNTPQNILDLGTGTGAIALALASEKPQWQLMAVDCVPSAVQLAIENCRQLGLTNIEINKSNWFNNVGNKKFDAIVSNPPYIDEKDEHLNQGDVGFEPKTALVAKDKGLKDIQLIVSYSRQYLTENGYLLVEHGWQQGEEVRQFFLENQFVDIETKKDLGGNERLTLGMLTPEK